MFFFSIFHINIPYITGFFIAKFRTYPYFFRLEKNPYFPGYFLNEIRNLQEKSIRGLVVSVWTNVFALFVVTKYQLNAKGMCVSSNFYKQPMSLTALFTISSPFFQIYNNEFLPIIFVLFLFKATHNKLNILHSFTENGVFKIMRFGKKCLRNSHVLSINSNKSV